ncbi:sigma-70 family RNA polymerase sigma factor [Eubacterium sp. An3]|uniref:RNA polymerase sigma factor n=1 Tax=Eubacterium sp. An3 TaxID=1965628 RepID=UPI001FA8E667|nr:sigma-70 family RNA polymerase sigma factor [Eubacterium sp. An3]
MKEYFSEQEAAIITDEEYYRRYLNGDEECLDALMKRHETSLILYITGYLHDIHAAEDLMIDVFTYLFTKKPCIQDGKLKSYLYKTARHMALRHKHKWNSCFSLDILEEEPESKVLVEEIVITAEKHHILRLCMEQLNPVYREALYLIYFEDMTYQEAGTVMRKSIKQITNIVYRGKQTLRKLLEKEGISDAQS